MPTYPQDASIVVDHVSKDFKLRHHRTMKEMTVAMARRQPLSTSFSALDNIYLNAAVLGMSEAETKRKLDSIIEFADIGQHLDSQVGHYSSGMTSRLGFAIAIHVDSDIFLADEVLAVGDKPFKKKCLEKMQEIRDSGRTLFYVSHAAGSVRKMCDRVIVLESGRVGYDGPVDAGIRFLHYEEENETEEEHADDELGADV